MLTLFLYEVDTSFSSAVSKGAKRGCTSLKFVLSTFSALLPADLSSSPGSIVALRLGQFPQLIVALEEVNFTDVAASHGLLLALFDLLSSLIEIAAAAQLDIQYLGQLLLSNLSKVIESPRCRATCSAEGRPLSQL